MSVTAQEAEEYVRSRWSEVRFESVNQAFEKWPERVQVWLPKDKGRVLAVRPNGGEWILSGNSNVPFEYSYALSRDEAWLCAYEFTKQREEEIRLAEFDIKHVRIFVNAVGSYCHEHPYTDHTLQVEIPNLQSWKRIMEREQQRLATLKQGMKEPVPAPKDGKVE